MKTTHLIAGAFTALAGFGAAHTASAQHIIATWVEPNHVVAQQTTQKWAERVEEATNGDMTFDVFVGGALMPAKSTLGGIADGLAQVGLHTALYTPSDLPVASAVADLGFVKPDPVVMSFAYSDFMMNDADGYGDWRDSGVIFLGSFSTPSYYFICRESLTTLADFEGKRIRMPGGGWARFGQEIKAVSVNVPSNEIYEAFERGTIDCTASDPTHLVLGATLKEVAGSVTLLSMSPFYATSTNAMNPDFWKGLSPEQRRALLNVTANSMAELEVEYGGIVERSFNEGKEAGITFVEPDASLQDAYDNWVADGIGGLTDLAKETYGIEDPDALFARFREYIEKWDGLLSDVDRTDVAALEALLKENLFDKIDVNSYGLE